MCTSDRWCLQKSELQLMRDNSFRTIQLWPKEVLNVQASTINFFITSQLNNFSSAVPWVTARAALNQSKKQWIFNDWLTVRIHYSWKQLLEDLHYVFCCLGYKYYDHCDNSVPQHSDPHAVKLKLKTTQAENVRSNSQQMSIYQSHSRCLK